MVPKIFAAMFLLVFSTAVSGRAQASPEVVVGDNVYVVPDAKAKVVTVWMIVHAGCRDEEDGHCRGLSHYLEHLMFLGRDARQEQNASAFFAAGQSNAFTSMMATSYYQSVPAKPESMESELSKLFGLFADRLATIDPPADAAARERNVVLQEFNFRRSDSFRVRFNNEVNARMLPGHPYSQPVIGSREDIAGYTVEVARKFHERWYARNNATFIVYGPVDPAEVKTLAARYLDPLPNKPLPGREWLDARRTFASMNTEFTRADKDIARPEVQVEKIVRFEDPFPRQTDAAKAILFDYLDSEIAGGLSDELVENQRLLTRVSADHSSIGAGAMWFTTHGTLEDGVAPETARKAIADYYVALAARGVDAKVVERLKKRALRSIAEVDKDPARTLTSLTNWFGQNRDYADWRARGEAVAAVTPRSLDAMLQAMAGPGRQLFGVMSPIGDAVAGDSEPPKQSTAGNTP